MSQQLTKQAKALLVDWEASDEIKQGCAKAVKQLFKSKPNPPINRSKGKVVKS